MDLSFHKKNSLEIYFFVPEILNKYKRSIFFLRRPVVAVFVVIVVVAIIFVIAFVKVVVVVD